MAKKLRNTTQIVDGKNDVKADVKRTPRTIDELLGRGSSNRYESKSYNEYDDYLKTLSLVDLQSHATQIGLLPTNNKEILKSRLLTEYHKTAGGYFGTVQFNPIEPKDKEKLLKILRKGK